MSDSFTPGTLVSTLLLSGRKGLRSNPHKAAKREGAPPIKPVQTTEEAPKQDESTCQQESAKQNEDEAAMSPDISEKETPVTANDSQKHAESENIGARSASILGGLVGRPQKKLRARGSVMQQRGAGDAAEKPKPPLVHGRRGPGAAVSQPKLSSCVDAPGQDPTAGLMPQEVWERAVDRVRCAVYYWEHLSGQSSWNPPPPHLGWWERLLDPTNSLEFFWNSLTHLTVWHLPIPSTPIQGEIASSHGHIAPPNVASPAAPLKPGLISMPVLPKVVLPPKRDKKDKGFAPLFDAAALEGMAAMLNGSSGEEPGSLQPIKIKVPVVVPPPPKARPPGVQTEHDILMPKASKARAAAPPNGNHHSAHTSSNPSTPKEPEQEPQQAAENGAGGMEPQQGSPHWDLDDPEQDAFQEQTGAGGKDADKPGDKAQPASEGLPEEDIVLDTADLHFDGKDMWSVLEDKVEDKVEDPVDDEEFRVEDMWSVLEDKVEPEDKEEDRMDDEEFREEHKEEDPVDAAEFRDEQLVEEEALASEQQDWKSDEEEKLAEEPDGCGEEDGFSQERPADEKPRDSSHIEADDVQLFNEDIEDGAEKEELKSEDHTRPWSNWTVRGSVAKRRNHEAPWERTSKFRSS
eukprot:TRINITY_DN31346_c0_g1_i1.p1 TRINITY_DN31346_c0_g1~~TRINITY_DN31346_c0_g1_i1.p1  ORF type:complete len:631 (-),score=159.07 TRINITY_DN31346_c0_g1_i1:21-1913(-)